MLRMFSGIQRKSDFVKLNNESMWLAYKTNFLYLHIYEEISETILLEPLSLSLQTSRIY